MISEIKYPKKSEIEKVVQLYLALEEEINTLEQSRNKALAITYLEDSLLRYIQAQ